MVLFKLKKKKKFLFLPECIDLVEDEIVPVGFIVQ